MISTGSQSITVFRQLARRFVSPVFVFAVIAVVSAQVKVDEGAQPYTPTRIEWLCLELNAESKEELTEEPGYSKHFTYSGDDPNTIILFVRYWPTIDRELVNVVVNNARRLVEIKVKNRDWTWVKIREDVEMIRR